MDEDGHGAPCSGANWSAGCATSRLPRLVFLASCQSAGPVTTGGARTPARWPRSGPRLAEAGVPAVVAMQGNIAMITAAGSPRPSSELHEDGRVDRATAVARAAVRERPDRWVPVLFIRLKSGGSGTARRRPGESDFESGRP